MPPVASVPMVASPESVEVVDALGSIVVLVVLVVLVLDVVVLDVVVLDVEPLPELGAAHAGLVTWLVSSVTWPFLAKSRPAIVAPVWAWMSVSAITVPTKVELVPNVAELVTCQ